MPRLPGKFLVAALVVASVAVAAQAAERVTLKNGFDLTCDHRAVDGSRVRLYWDASGTSFLEINASDIASVESVQTPPSSVAAQTAPAPPQPAKLTDAELRPMLDAAGTTYNLEVDLLASVVREESGGHPRAVSHAGAQGLMQLMPATATELGVANSFAPRQNIQGGTEYLDAMLRRYHDNLSLALAAYNAGPAAVDRWHGIPPYAETRAYVARVIHEYNRRYALRQNASARAALAR